MSSSSSDPPPTLVSFARGIIATLTLWPALRMAVEGNWGGPESSQKRIWLGSAVVDAFEDASNKNENVPDALYVEEMLLQVLADEFDVVLEDGSAQPVSAGIVRLWREVMHEGRVDGVVEVERLVEKSHGKRIAMDEKDASDEECQWEEDDAEESGSEDEDAPQLLDHAKEKTRKEPEIDEEGFTTVKGRGRSAR